MNVLESLLEYVYSYTHAQSSDHQRASADSCGDNPASARLVRRCGGHASKKAQHSCGRRSKCTATSYIYSGIFFNCLSPRPRRRHNMHTYKVEATSRSTRAPRPAVHTLPLKKHNVQPMSCECCGQTSASTTSHPNHRRLLRPLRRAGPLQPRCTGRRASMRLAFEDACRCHTALSSISH